MDETTPLRQFRVTITEDPRGPGMTVNLSWRAFPCSAAHWDGHWVAQVSGLDAGPIESQEHLRMVLEHLAGIPWENGIYPR
jgi:hypothetical protein